jgi:putative hydrolase of the HAD superfamily
MTVRTGSPATARAVLFDHFGTLTNPKVERDRDEMVSALGRALGVPPSAFCEVMRWSFPQRAIGQLGDLCATLDELCRRLGHVPGPARLARAAGLRMAHERVLAEPTPGALAVLRELRHRGYLLGVVTDCSSELPSLWSELGYAAAVDAVSFSSEVGQRKPNPTMYLTVCKQLDVDAAECLYVGDGGSHELSGAAAVGMTAIWLDTGAPSDLRYDSELNWTGTRIQSLERLLELVPHGRSDR